MPVQPDAGPALSAEKAPPQKSKTKSLLIGAAFLVSTLAAAYGTGRLQTAHLVRQAESRATEADRSARELRAKILRFDARRHVHLALLALDERNFGIAQSELARAGKLLKDSEPPAGSDLDKLATSLLNHRLVATEDLGTQHHKILKWVRVFDGALPPSR